MTQTVSGLTFHGTTGTTGTTATALIRKVFSQFRHGACSGTHVERERPVAEVPHSDMEQVHNWNKNNLYKTMGYAICSGVPVATQLPAKPICSRWDWGAR
jgi:hypothetical protein